MYAKMCMEANLDWTPQVGTWIAQKGNFGNRGVIFAASDESIWIGNSYSPDPLVSKNTLEFTKKDFFPLWSQKQLQDMIDGDWMRVLVALYDYAFKEVTNMCGSCFNEQGRFADGEKFYEACIDKILKRWNSLKQLLLSFVMHEKFGKVWDFEKERWKKKKPLLISEAKR